MYREKSLVPPRFRIPWAEFYIPKPRILEFPGMQITCELTIWALAFRQSESNLQSCSSVILCHALPLLFVALHEYRPKSPAVLGVSVNVLMSWEELKPSKMGRSSLNHVKFAGGLAFTAHFKLVLWCSQDFSTAFEEVVMLMWGRSGNSKFFASMASYFIIPRITIYKGFSFGPYEMFPMVI